MGSQRLVAAVVTVQVPGPDHSSAVLPPDDQIFLSRQITRKEGQVKFTMDVHATCFSKFNLLAIKPK